MGEWVPRPPDLSDKLIDWSALAQVGGEDLFRGKVVVECGPAWGQDTVLLSGHAEKWIALDYSAHVNTMVETRGTHADVIECDLTKEWPIAEGCADTVLDFSTFDDTSDPIACYAQAARALKPDGVLVTSYANAAKIESAGTYTATLPQNLLIHGRCMGLYAFRRLNEDGPRAVMAFRRKMYMKPTIREVGFWKCAGGFPANKEEVYPGHAEAEMFDQNAGKRVLEYGCGGGSDAMSWLRRGCEVTFTDIVAGNVEIALERIRQAGLSDKALGMVLEESDRIPLSQDGQFDVISSHGVLHHIKDPRPILREMRRLLKPGGWLVIMLYTERLRSELDNAVREIHVATGIHPDEAFGWTTDGEGCPYARAYTEAEGRALLAECGFELKSTRMTNEDRFRTFQAQ